MMFGGEGRFSPFGRMMNGKKAPLLEKAAQK